MNLIIVVYMIFVIKLVVAIDEPNPLNAENGKSKLINYWKDRTLYTLMATVANDLSRYASKEVLTAFQACQRDVTADSFGYSECLDPFITETKHKAAAAAHQDYAKFRQTGAFVQEGN